MTPRNFRTLLQPQNTHWLQPKHRTCVGKCLSLCWTCLLAASRLASALQSLALVRHDTPSFIILHTHLDATTCIWILHLQKLTYA